MNYYGQQNMQSGMPPMPPMYIPEDYVTYEEKRKIRHNYNVIGLTLFILYIAILIVCSGGYLFYMVMTGNEGSYDEAGYSIYSAAELFIGGAMPAITAIIVFFGYCLCTRYNPKELFSVSGVKAGEVLRYVMIVLFFQQVSLLCTIFISSTLNSMDRAHQPGKLAQAPPGTSFNGASPGSTTSARDGRLQECGTRKKASSLKSAMR